MKGLPSFAKIPDSNQAPPQPLDGETGYYPDRDSFLLWSFLC